MNRLLAASIESAGARIALLAAACWLFACGPVNEGLAQVAAPDGSTSGVGSQAHDYFARDRDPNTAALLRTVEQYHLSDSFWRLYRKGEFGSARSDLQFVLQWFPNHPKALQLIAYDPNVKLDPSQVIQQFELANRLFPGHAFTYAQYGRYLTSIGRRSIGLELLDEALQADPDLVAALAWRAEGAAAPVQPPAESSGGPGANRSSSKSSNSTPHKKP